MIVLRLRMGADNISYVVSGGGNAECAVIDPIDYDEILETIDVEGLGKVAVVFNTHGHPDHTSGNQGLIQRTGATLLAHDPDRSHVPGGAESVKDGDVISVGNLDIKVLHTPGHTAGGICLYVAPDGHRGRLFSGDTVFLSGCGNPRFGGDPDRLFESFESKIFTLPPETILEPGHDYAVNNLKFALSVEPDNGKARDKLKEVARLNADDQIPSSTLAEEREYNPFFRLDSPAILRKVGETSPGRLDERSVFLALRELRNRW